jgi:outer membrane protein TolC
VKLFGRREAHVRKARAEVEASVARSRRTSAELFVLVEQVRAHVRALDRQIEVYLEGREQTRV